MSREQVRVERKGTYQGVPQWGITSSSEITPSKATCDNRKESGSC